MEINQQPALERGLSIHSLPSSFVWELAEGFVGLAPVIEPRRKRL